MVGSKAMMKKEFTDWLTQAAVKVTFMMMMMILAAVMVKVLMMKGFSIMFADYESS